MAETRPAAPVRPVTTVQVKKTSNNISWIAPLLCIIVGYLIWRFGLGNASNFDRPGTGWFWPDHHEPRAQLYNMYLGGIVVPVLLGTFLTCVVFAIERFLTIRKATGTGNNADFVRRIQYHLANKNIDAALAECDKQKGSVGNVMKAGLFRYKDMISNNELTTDQKVLAIQKEVEEATALELPMLEKNLVFLSTIATVATLIGLFGTVLGMIRAFAALGQDSGGGSSAASLSQGIAEALYNTALGIGTSALAIIFYNMFTTRIDAITYGIDESAFTLTQSFASLYK